jgi:uncharacterized protein (DUF4415 family)
MTERRRDTGSGLNKIGSDLKAVDAHEITAEEYAEIPELTEEDFARGEWHIGGVPVSRGRPKSQNAKEHVNLRLDSDVLAHFRAGGPGWQSRINATLRKAAKLDVPTKRKSGPARRG